MRDDAAGVGRRDAGIERGEMPLLEGDELRDGLLDDPRFWTVERSGDRIDALVQRGIQADADWR